MIRARPTVEALHRYVAPLEGRRGLLRLDFNENTLGPSPRVVRSVQALGAEDYAVYPEYEGLLADFAQSAGLAVEEVSLFNGADAALKALFEAFGKAGETFVTTSPTFGYYQPCADLARMHTVAVPYGEDLSFPLSALDAALDHRAGICILCNPNNPSGTLVESQVLLELAARHPQTLFVIDEIYAPYTNVSVLPEATQTENVVAIRSLSKSSGLAALRVGFACGPARLVELAYRVSGPYDVNAFGVVAARAALADASYTESYVKQVKEAKLWMREELSRLGLRHSGQGGNWLVVWPGKDEQSLVRSLRTEGILVRSMKGKPLLDGSFRLTIGTLEQMQRFARVLETLL